MSTLHNEFLRIARIADKSLNENMPFLRRGGHGDQAIAGCYTRQIPNAGSQYDLARFNPYEVEQLLRRFFECIEVCLNLRNEYFSLDVLDRNLITETQLANDLAAIDKKIVELPTQHKTYELLSNQRSHVESFASETAAPKRIVGEDASIALSKAHFEAAKNLQIKRLEELDEFQKQIIDRSKEDFNGLNYRQRKGDLAQRFTELLLECTSLALGVLDGTKIVYGIDAPLFPDATKPSYLDELLSWAKTVLAILEIALRRDVEYGLTLSLKMAKQNGNYLVSNWTSKAAHNATRTATVALGMESIRFSFNRDWWFPSQKFIRFRGVSCGIEGPGIWRVLIRPPAIRIGTDAAAIEIPNLPSLRFGDAGARPAPNNRASNAQVGPYFNSDPCGGDWEVRIIGPSTDGEPFSKITDIHIDFKIAVLE